MNLLAAAVLTFSLLASGSAYAQAGASGSDAGSQRIKVTRKGERSPTLAPAEHFTGSMSVDRFLVESASSRLSGLGRNVSSQIS